MKTCVIDLSPLRPSLALLYTPQNYQAYSRSQKVCRLWGVRKRDCPFKSPCSRIFARPRGDRLSGRTSTPLTTENIEYLSTSTFCPTLLRIKDREVSPSMRSLSSFHCMRIRGMQYTMFTYSFVLNFFMRRGNIVNNRRK